MMIPLIQMSKLISMVLALPYYTYEIQRVSLKKKNNQVKTLEV